MDKKQLSQISYLQSEIVLIKNQIDNLECDTVTDSVRGSDYHFPYVERTIQITGVDTEGYNQKVVMLKRRLHKRMTELIDTKGKLNEYIESIDDSELRQILTLRYIENLTWREIGKRMSIEGDGSTERKKHDRFLKVSPNSPKK